MKIAYIGVYHDYGYPDRTPSYEHDHFEEGLKRLNNHEVEFFHPDIVGEIDVLRDKVNRNEFDILFHVEFNDNLDLPIDIAQLAMSRGKKVVCWSSDASYRFHNWILLRKNRYNLWITTHNCTIPWYKENNMPVIKSQWFGSPLYSKIELPKIYDVSFCAQKHGLRGNIIDLLIKNGINVHLFGEFWDGYPNNHGVCIDAAKLNFVYNSSKINLNIQTSWNPNTQSQIKGRYMDIPNVGGFQLATPADDYEMYFVENKEIVIAHSMTELITKIKYYLENDKERDDIALAGYNRSMKDHVWSTRLQTILQEIGLS